MSRMAQLLENVGPHAYHLAQRRRLREPRPVPRCVVGGRVVRGRTMGGWDLEMTAISGRVEPNRRFCGYLKTFEVGRCTGLLDQDVVVVDELGQGHPARVVGVQVDREAGELAWATVDLR